jgi:DNA transposition AAA+ family ATPase
MSEEQNELSVKAIVDQLQVYIEEKGVSAAKIAKAIGVHESALSSFRSMSYKGDVSSLAKRIIDFLAIEGERKSGIKIDLKPVRTQQTDMVVTVCKMCHEYGEMGFIFGDAGVGKSTGLKMYKAKYDSQVILVSAYAGITPDDLLFDVLEAMKAESGGGENRKMREVIRLLKDTGKLLIIDEAQHCSNKAIEKIRAVWDSAQTGIVLCGNNVTVKTMRGGREKLYFAHVVSRFAFRVEITSKVLREDLNAILENAGVKITQEIRNYLFKRASSDGCYREMMHYFRKALIFAASENRDITMEDIHVTERFRNGVGFE